MEILFTNICLVLSRNARQQGLDGFRAMTPHRDMAIVSHPLVKGDTHEYFNRFELSCLLVTIDSNIPQATTADSAEIFGHTGKRRVHVKVDVVILAANLELRFHLHE